MSKLQEAKNKIEGFSAVKLFLSFLLPIKKVRVFHYHFLARRASFCALKLTNGSSEDTTFPMKVKPKKCFSCWTSPNQFNFFSLLKGSQLNKGWNSTVSIKFCQSSCVYYFLSLLLWSFFSFLFSLCFCTFCFGLPFP